MTLVSAPAKRYDRGMSSAHPGPSGYRSVKVFSEGELSPLGAPAAVVGVRDLLP